MAKELNEDTGFKISVKTLIGIGFAMATIIGMWFTLQADIDEAKLLPEPPPPDVTRMEFDMKDQLIRQTIMTTQKDVEEVKEDLKVIQFNANWNSANSVTWLSKLSDCKVGEIDIATNTAAKTKYKIVVVPTIIVFDHGEEVKRYQANIMMQIEAKLEDIQNLVDETVMNSF